MKARHKRLAILSIGVAVLGVAAALVINALGNNLSYFFSPTEIVENKAPQGHIFRLGGLVEPGSLQRGQELTVRFAVTDNKNRIMVSYTGILPDLFQEGQGVIAQGRMGEDGVFVAVVSQPVGREERQQPWIRGRGGSPSHASTVQHGVQQRQRDDSSRAAQDGAACQPNRLNGAEERALH